MGFRTVVINERSKLETRLGSLLVRGEKEKQLYISEIDTLIIGSCAGAISLQALHELSKKNVNVIFCDEKHLPYASMALFKANYTTSGNIQLQIHWKEDRKALLWQRIIVQKILHQSQVLRKYGEVDAAEILMDYMDEVQPNDVTNREGHAAKVYFNALFGEDFSRRAGGTTNAALNYTYAILVSAIARYISAAGYLNAVGIWHKNQFNDFNFAYDLLEIFRPIADDWAITYCTDDDFKESATKILTTKVKIKNQQIYLDFACESFVHWAIRFLNEETDDFFRVESYEI
jgi:CRISPR-associated endonuclease Cas1 subtype II